MVLLLAAPFFAGPAKAISVVHETVDIKVDNANLYILVTNPANGEEAGYTSLTSSVNTFPSDNGANVYAILISPQEVQLWSDVGFEGSNAIDFNVRVSDPPASFTLTITHLNDVGSDPWGPGTWSGSLGAGQYCIVNSGIDVNGYVMGIGQTLFVLPEYALGGLLALGACLAACVVFQKRRSL
jgi:hypothetical protein